MLLVIFVKQQILILQSFIDHTISVEISLFISFSFFYDIGNFLRKNAFYFRKERKICFKKKKKKFSFFDDTSLIFIHKFHDFEETEKEGNFLYGGFTSSFLRELLREIERKAF